MDFWELGLRSIKELESEHGILASSRGEKYACIFGRDSLITALMLLHANKKRSNPYFLYLVSKILRNLSLLQGKEFNLESGEEPGKIIHEWRPTGHEHLTSMTDSPWYLYPDNVMRNYDTVDATPLYLMTAYEYWESTKDEALMRDLLPSIRGAIEWIVEFGDNNGDGLIDYQFHPERTYGGLRTQSWMDSTESIFFERSDELPSYPIAPVEVQAYTFCALSSWAQFFASHDGAYSTALYRKAADLKSRFNARFLTLKGSKRQLAFAIEGSGRRLTTPRSSMGHVLWATAKVGGSHESVLESEYIPEIAERLLAKDMFARKAGIRTLSSRSSHFDPTSYHNGSIWPHDTAILAIGLENFGYNVAALNLRNALKCAYRHFATPIELYGYSRGKYLPYAHAGGSEGACKIQAWSAAALLSLS